ncbi:chromosome segregation protein SMC [Hyphomicrobium sp.]|uniref:chromosome segregation protein SMC n=1 Tax=Hyphomicrobium sp. TaxID=82 RepID=UPI000FAA0176|nr:chromosome segregation protein SMC [Hyphomicrobium sp.]RUO97299.1 MAG: chromosome segregation protein SMC [Hyphomicrobium sp.]
MKITRLRLLGFKSFVDPTELVIEPGLTGVVGPNGCGKSNLLEALRWVMGESSHKSMRAAAMDDVIFSGSGGRPERQSAEVTMFLDNSARKAPAEFNGGDIIEITRRIEREAGSAYRINGREVRARDVKVLFEDAATGARSPALVRQGQIGELVNAKPEQRRRILEDAAGIAGLHTRRHEAELKLRAAEANIERVSDVVGQLQSQTESLKRQARQARRYKELSSEIRQQEALALHLTWEDAQRSVDAEEAQLTDAMMRLGAATEAETKSFNAEIRLTEALPPLREAEAAKGAALARFKIEQENLEREATRAAERARELDARAKQLEADLKRESGFISEAKETLLHLDADLAAIQEADRKGIEEEAAEKITYEAAEQRRATADAHFADITHRAADARARLRSLESALAERKDVVAKVTRQIAAFDAQIADLRAKAPDSEKLSAMAQRGQALAQEISAIEASALAAEETVRAAQAEAKARRDEAQRVRLAANAFSTERETIAKLLASGNADAYPPAVDYIRVSPGYEPALGAALGDDLEAPIAPEAAVHWRRLDLPAEDHALPADAEPLDMHVEAPIELARRLRQIGVVQRADGARLQPHLKPGQRLVSPEGDLWRWDGFVAASHGVTPAAQRLAHKNRLAELDRKAQAVLNEAKETIDAERAAATAMQQAEAEERRLRQLYREKQNELAQVRQQLTGLEKLQRESETRLAAVTAQRARADEDLTTAQARHVEIEAHIVTMSEGEDLEPVLKTAQAEAEGARREVAEARVRLGSLDRDKQIRAERIRHSHAEIARWKARQASAEAQVESLSARLKEAQDEITATADLPAKISAQRENLLSALSRAEAERKAAADALAEAETAAKAAVDALRANQAEVSAAREAKARIETRLENARHKRQEAARDIRETFEVAPENCLALAGLPDASAIPPLVDVERHLTKLKADRERLGGVNLQADEDLADISKQLESLLAERDDLEQGIAKLRQAIQQLNREGKSRLDEAFQTVNTHFERLFTHLFGGGEARLEMIESPEDPLEGGLEIIAKPPGKKPATLSLLSGGEQTLTALSLIFAVFLTNPSPICVLDEVDAPLDDANVDRFCRLMEQMSAETETRFLVITHHPMTMARMNRLFGVTMAEKGVSQLVSVDLQTAQSFREAS